MRILLVTPMWPTSSSGFARGLGVRCADSRAQDPTRGSAARDVDFGAFLVPHAEALRALGHELAVVAIDRRGGSPLKYAGLAARAVTAAVRRRPDVVYAHMLFPAGAAALAAARAARVPLVVMAHGQDVVNLRSARIRRATAPVTRAAAAVIANSNWLAGEIERRLPGTAATVADLGVDLDRFDPAVVTPAVWPGAHPRLLCVGTLSQRKNVIALADAFAALGEGSLVFAGDGELRQQLEGRDGVTVLGRVPHAQVPSWIAACDVLCQPSLSEPFGIAALEAMALERPVLGTVIGGPPEFVPPEAGVLVDPRDGQALLAGLRDAIALGAPNPAARAAAAAHSTTRQAERVAAVLQDACDRRAATR